MHIILFQSIIVFSIGMGTFNAIMVLLYQMIEDYGYSNDDAGSNNANVTATTLLYTTNYYYL